jgi:transposase, IS30 family
MARPRYPRELVRQFWRGIRRGLVVEEAALAVGVAPSTGRAWFVQAGGMPPLSLTDPTGRFLSNSERHVIEMGVAAGFQPNQIAAQLGRHPTTIVRELARNTTPHWPQKYNARTAQEKAEVRGRRPKPRKLAGCQPLCAYIEDKMSGEEHWSPRQISRRICLEYPDDEQMRISHETIYRTLFVQGNGELRRELHQHLRTGRALRKPRSTQPERRGHLKDMVNISERPAEVEDRAVPGHWEGDLIIGKDGLSAVATLVERTTRFVLLPHLAGDRTAPAVRDAIAKAIAFLPEQLRLTLTWDQGAELAEHLQLQLQTGLEIYFCDPHSPWQRGSNENTNGLLRQYMPKGTDLRLHSPERLAEIAAGLNGRPRETLGWHTPAEALAALLSGTQPTIGAATTP